MRAMKFRAWNKSARAMLEWGYLRVCGQHLLFVDSLTWMQFTGLHDKNGKEIYEGDVVKHYNGVNTVTWETGLASFQMSFSNFVLDQEIIPDYSECEVIGNIYENPELVGGTQKGLDLEG